MGVSISNNIPCDATGPEDQTLSSKGLKSDSVVCSINLLSAYSVTIELWLVYQNPCQIWYIIHFVCPRLLLRIPLYSFSMVLVDKHGMDKERYVSLVTPVALFNLIDTFPLRKEEMALQAEMGQTCNTWCNGSSLCGSSSLSI